MRKLGLNQISIMNFHYARFSADYFFRSAERNGFQSVSFWAGLPHFFIDAYSYSDAGRIRALAEKHHLTIDCFTVPSCGYGYQYGMQPDEIRPYSLRYFQNGILAAEELGCRWIAVNSGWGYFDVDPEEGWKRSRDMLRALAEFAGEHGIILTFENLRGAETNLAYRLADTKRMLEEVGHPSLKAMVDTTAMRQASEDLEEWFSVLGGSICNMHFVDASPEGHLIWGDGNTDLKRCIECLERNDYTGMLGLEITDKRYFADPAAADRKCLSVLKPYFHQEGKGVDAIG